MKMKECGECFACCAGVLSFKEEDLEVVKGCVCPNLISNKCSIYESRPNICKNYFCAWKIDDEMPDFMRPDKSGMIITKRFEEDLIYYSIDFVDEKNINLHLFSLVLKYFFYKKKNVVWIIEEKIYWIGEEKLNYKYLKE